MNPEVNFDYGRLPDEHAEVAAEAAEAIRACQQRSLENILAMGEKLFEVKNKLDHGLFGEWVKAEFGWSVRSAQRWIRVWSECKDIHANLSYLPQTTVYALVAPSTPPNVRKQIVERLESGEKLPSADVIAMVRSARKQSTESAGIAKSTMLIEHDSTGEHCAQQKEATADIAAREAVALLRERLGDEVGTFLELSGQAGAERIIRHLAETNRPVQH